MPQKMTLRYVQARGVICSGAFKSATAGLTASCAATHNTTAQNAENVQELPTT